MRPVLLLSLTIAFLAYQTADAQLPGKKQINAIQTVNVWPMTIGPNDGNDTTIYFFRNDTALIRTSYISNFTFRGGASDGEDSIHSTLRYRYFIYKKGEKTGRWMEDYQPVQKKFQENDSVESVLHSLIGNFYMPLADYIRDSITLIGSKVEQQVMEKTYIFKSHQHLKGADTLILSFSPKFRHPDFIFYNYTPVEDNYALYSVRMIVQCDDAIKMNMPELALIKIHHYLSEVSPTDIAKAEKYFTLFRSFNSTASGR